MTRLQSRLRTHHRSAGDGSDNRIDEPDQIGRRDGHVEATTTSAHVDQLLHRGAGVDDRQVSPLLSDGADPADDVPSRSFRPGGVAHHELLRAERGGRRSELQAPVHRDHGDRDELGGRHHQRLEHLLVRKAERFGCLATEVGQLPTPFVLVDPERNPRRFE